MTAQDISINRGFIQSGDFLDVAKAIGDQLVGEAFWINDRCTWMGYDMDLVNQEWAPVLASLDESLYGGLPGLALFLSKLGVLTNEESYATAAKGAINQTFQLLKNKVSVPDHGFYSGLAGTLWAIQEAETMLGIESYQPIYQDQFKKLLAAADDSHGEFDLVDGIAGTIVGLLALRSGENQDRVLTACKNLANRLSQHACCGPGTGISWVSHSESRHNFPLCGLAHGASSAAIALLELGVACDDRTYIDLANQGFQYERQWFDREHSNWPDLRTDNDGQMEATGDISYPTYWCHGAGGIGLSRLRAYVLTGSDNALAEANAAIYACSEYAKRLLSVAQDESHNFELNVSLCHGLGGIVELLLYAHSVDPGTEFLSLANDIGRFLVRRQKVDNEWCCGVPGGGETPGLMLGLAGAGLIFLGLNNPDHFYPVGLPPVRTI